MRFEPVDPPLPAPESGGARPRRRLGVDLPPPVDPAAAQNILTYRPFPAWARRAGEAPAADAAAFFAAGAGLALLDRSLRGDDAGAAPAFAGVLRSRLALKAAAACVRLARLRADESALRDAAHLAVADDPGPAGRLHRLFRLGAARPLRLDAPALSEAAALLQLRASAATLAGLAAAAEERAAKAATPLAAAAGASLAATAALAADAPLEAEIFAFWLADLALAQALGWTAPVPLLAAAVLQPALRRAGRRPRPADADWSDALAGAYAAAAAEAYALAGELARRAQNLRAAAPKLRAKGAARVVALLLADDAVAPARAAKQARLSDRAARRLFDRLIALGVVRELSGRASFRLYGL
jgi:hypothetical protein